MSEPFPSKALIALSRDNADRLREEWEPKPGDWATEKSGKACFLVLDAVEVETTKVSRIVAWAAQDVWEFRTSDLIPLFQPRQIIRMLEERGYALAHLGDERCEPDFEGRKWNPEEPYMALAQKEPGDYVKGTGPDLATSLLRAWLEVVKEEK